MRLQLPVRTFGFQNPSLPAVMQADVEDLPEPFPGAVCKNRRHHLDAFRKIPEHPVRRSDEEFALDRILLAIRKVKDT